MKKKLVFLFTMSLFLSLGTMKANDDPLMYNSTSTLEASIIHQGDVLIVWQTKDLPKKSDQFVLYKICDGEILSIVESLNIKSRKDGQQFMVIDTESSPFASYQLVLLDKKGNVRQSRTVGLESDQSLISIKSTLAHCD